jgi:membrane-associated phospholipid phosphatase
VANLTHVGHDSVAVNSLVNQYAAIPSMHVAFALMIAVPLARLSKHRVTRVIWTVYPFVVVFVIISTANHFLTDAFLGACTAAFGAWTATNLARARDAWAFEPAKAHA